MTVKNVSLSLNENTVTCLLENECHNERAINNKLKLIGTKYCIRIFMKRNTDVTAKTTEHRRDYCIKR